jgi:hypothetical protein
MRFPAIGVFSHFLTQDTEQLLGREDHAPREAHHRRLVSLLYEICARPSEATLKAQEVCPQDLPPDVIAAVVVLQKRACINFTSGGASVQMHTDQGKNKQTNQPHCVTAVTSLPLPFDYLNAD